MTAPDGGLVAPNSRTWNGATSCYSRGQLGGQHVGQVVGNGLLQLVVAAALRIAVGAPATELGGVPEPPALHVVVGDLDHEVGPQRREAEVLALTPPALRPGHPVRVGGQELRPAPPRVLFDGYDERLELLDQLGPSALGEAGADADVLELPTVVQTQQEAAEQGSLGRARLVLAVAGDHHVGRPFVLD